MLYGLCKNYSFVVNLNVIITNKKALLKNENILFTHYNIHVYI